METDYREEKLLVNIGDVAGESRLLFNDVILTGKIKNFPENNVKIFHKNELY